MQKLILFVACLISLNLSAQCKFEKQEVDEFTGKKVLETSSVSLISKFYPPNYLDISIRQEDTTYTIKASWFGPLGGKDAIIESDYLALKTPNGVVTGKPDHHYESFNNGSWTLAPTYRIKKKDVELLASDPVEAFRITSNGTEMDFKIRPVVAEKLKIAAGCVLNEN